MEDDIYVYRVYRSLDGNVVMSPVNLFNAEGKMQNFNGYSTVDGDHDSHQDNDHGDDHNSDHHHDGCLAHHRLVLQVQHQVQRISPAPPSSSAPVMFPAPSPSPVVDHHQWNIIEYAIISGSSTTAQPAVAPSPKDPVAPSSLPVMFPAPPSQCRKVELKPSSNRTLSNTPSPVGLPP